MIDLLEDAHDELNVISYESGRLQRVQNIGAFQQNILWDSVSCLAVVPGESWIITSKDLKPTDGNIQLGKLQLPKRLEQILPLCFPLTLNCPYALLIRRR
jgi:hypothetical protein